MKSENVLSIKQFPQRTEHNTTFLKFKIALLRGKERLLIMNIVRSILKNVIFFRSARLKTMCPKQTTGSENRSPESMTYFSFLNLNQTTKNPVSFCLMFVHRSLACGFRFLLTSKAITVNYNLFRGGGGSEQRNRLSTFKKKHTRLKSSNCPTITK